MNIIVSEELIIFNAVTEPSKTVSKARVVRLLKQGEAILRGLKPGADPGDAATMAQLNAAKEAFPVNSIFITVDTKNPKELLGYGEWIRFAEGRVLIGCSTTDPRFALPGMMAGEYEHTITLDELPFLNSTSAITNETPSGTQDNVNTAFTTLHNYKSGSLMLVRNGIFDFDIVENGTNQFTITAAPDPADVLKVIYSK